MTAKIDTIVQAAAPVLVPAPKDPYARAPRGRASNETPEQRKAAHEERVARWKAIAEAGGIDPWVRAELGKKGLATDHLDPTSMGGKELAHYKELKKNEAVERRSLRRLAWQAWQATHVTHLGVGVHWDEDASPDRYDVEDGPERLRAAGLPEWKSPDDLAKALGLTIPRLRWLTFHREVDTGSHYRRWQVPKRSGGTRTITAPKRELKAAQRAVLRSIAEKLPVHGAAHGFLAGRSIVTNAKVHAGAHTLVKVDVKDFFPTVTWRRVKGLYRKAGYPEQVATLLALLGTESPRETVAFRGQTLFVAAGPRALPQGAPTSPALTNALCLRMDRRLSGLAKLFGFRYTRYADDLTFSWRAPADAPEGTHPKAPVGSLLKGVGQILRAEGFAMHPAKTEVLRRGSRQEVTGLVVNEVGPGVAEARVPRDVRRRLKAAIRNREQGKAGREGETLAQLKGMAAFVYMTDPAKGRAYLDRLAALEAREG
ncbi:MAG: reverse transcriptase family protein [Polyangiales bacterium]